MNPLILSNKITEEEYSKRFPLPFVVSALNPWEAARKSLSPDRTWWKFSSPFSYVSDRFGRIDIEAGFITDFASIPPALRSKIDDDSPEMLRASAPHDKLFSTKGVIPHSGKILTFTECNQLLTEAMYYCGASGLLRAEVFAAVELFGKSHWN